MARLRATRLRAHMGWIRQPATVERRPLWLALLLVLALAGGCAPVGVTRPQATPTATTTAPAGGQTQADELALTVLNNIKANGFDDSSSINNGLGGLWINWRYGTNPLQTNLNGSGESQDQSSGQPLRHDRLTDLRYLHNLWLYKSLHPSDTQFDSEVQRYTAIVKAEFTPAQDDRGWVYDEMSALYTLSHDSFYQDAARQLATYFASSKVQPMPGVVYKTSATELDGYYRVDLALEIGCALVQAGTTFHQPDWVSQGEHIIQFVYSQAYIPAYHTIVYQMNHVLAPDGSLNTNATIMRGLYGNTHIEGGQVRAGSIGQVILSFLHAYQITHDSSYLNRATDLLTLLTSDNNILSLWDSDHLGYYSQSVFPGPTVSDAGTPKSSRNKKESGRQLQMLEVFRVANTLTNGKYAKMQSLMEQVTMQKAYYAPGHGYLYEMSASWQPLNLSNGQREDWVTTEAMGIALEAIFSLEEPKPW